MRTNRWRINGLSLSLAPFFIIGTFSLAHADSGYMGSFSSKYPASSLVSNCGVCHTSIPSLNTYGSDFKKNKFNPATIESLDSDGDSFSNLIEINAGTYPGDATSHPTAPPPPASDTTPPSVTSFSIPSSSSTLSISISSFAATDNVGVTGYMITESATPPASGSPGWNSLPPSTYLFTSTGEKTLYAWAKDAAGNVSSGVGATVSVSVPVEGQGPI